MKSVDAESVAEEMVKMFARVGLPEEILTDQGSVVFLVRKYSGCPKNIILQGNHSHRK